MTRRPPRSTRTDTLFPYTTLFRSAVDPVNHYRVEYQGIDDTWFKLDYRALHTAYDINDPAIDPLAAKRNGPAWDSRSEEHTSELQSLMRNSYAVFCCKKKNNHHEHEIYIELHKETKH